jgi:hypothetical protein
MDGFCRTIFLEVMISDCVCANLSGCTAQQRSKDVNLREIAAPKTVSIEEQWGIEVQEIRLSSTGCMLDFRYKVADPTKTVPALRIPVESYVIDQSSEKKLSIPRPPKIGPLCQTTLRPEAGRVYFTIFTNPGKKENTCDILS